MHESTLPGSRDSRLIEWASGGQYAASSAFDVQGRLIDLNRSWAEEIVSTVAAENVAAGVLSNDDRSDTAFRALKGLVRAYDPGVHGEGFRLYAEQYLRGMARHCCAAGSCILPHQGVETELETYLQDPPETQPMPSLTATPPAQAEQREGRNERLAEWGQRCNLHGQSTFDLQGTIIRRFIQSMRSLADELSTGTDTLNNPDLQNAGFRTLKGLVQLFDPEEHGEDFWAWAQPCIITAMVRCNTAQCMVIPDKPDATYIEGLVAERAESVTAVEEPPQNTVTKPPQSAATTAGTPDAHAARTDPVPPSTNSPTPPEAPPPPEPPPDPQPSEEDLAEKKRQRRFCRLASDAFDIPVDQDQFEEAVAGVCAKLENMAKSTGGAVQLPPRFKGGKTAVRKEAVRMLPSLVRDYDPPNEPDASAARGRCVGYVKERLVPAIQEHVRG